MKKILVIDDDEKILEIFKRFLESMGHIITYAGNGREGLQMLESNPPDLVITDIMMPEADGLEVIMALRRRSEAIPIIAISGGMHAMPMDFLPTAKKFGARKVLYKPVELSVLSAAVNEVFA